MPKYVIFTSKLKKLLSLRYMDLCNLHPALVASLSFTLVSFKLGAVHKAVRREGVVQCGQGEREYSDADVRTFWLKKHRIFRNLWCVRTYKGGWASAETLQTRGEGVKFSRFLV